MKLADFGFGRIADGGVMRTMCGSPAFVAPEVIAGKVRQQGVAAPSSPQQPGSHYERTGRGHQAGSLIPWPDASPTHPPPIPPQADG